MYDRGRDNAGRALGFEAHAFEAPTHRGARPIPSTCFSHRAMTAFPPTRAGDGIVRRTLRGHGQQLPFQIPASFAEAFPKCRLSSTGVASPVPLSDGAKAV